LKGGETVTLYFLTEGGVSDGIVYRVFSPSGLSAPQSDLPMFGDFFGAYGVDMSDAVAGLQIMTSQDVDIKALEGISPSPSRGLDEIVFILKKLSGESRP
jgi:hypothetical protein